MMEGSGAVTNGSGCVRPKNIRIRNTATKRSYAWISVNPPYTIVDMVFLLQVFLGVRAAQRDDSHPF
jgi:hypothetical protein